MFYSAIEKSIYDFFSSYNSRVSLLKFSLGLIAYYLLNLDLLIETGSKKVKLKINLSVHPIISINLWFVCYYSNDVYDLDVN